MCTRSACAWPSELTGFSLRRACECEYLWVSPVPTFCPYPHWPSLGTISIPEIERKEGHSVRDGKECRKYEWGACGLVRLWHACCYKLDSGQAGTAVWFRLLSVFSLSTWGLVTAFTWSDNECALENDPVLSMWNGALWRTHHACSQSCFSPVWRVLRFPLLNSRVARDLLWFSSLVCSDAEL